MKAIIVDVDQADRPLVWQDVPDPTYGADEVLVHVTATALNRADLMQRAGAYPPPPGAPAYLGLEMAGTISAAGANVSDWQIGDRVCALLPGGGYAEQVSVPQQMLMPMPPDWSFEQAAAVPEVFLTAFVNLFMEANFQPGERVLIHGGASGVGTAAIQLIREAGGVVFATAGTDEKVARCRELGAELAVNYKTADFAEAIETHAGQRSVDIILDMVGANYFERNLKLLNLQGRLVFIATLSGTKTQLNIGALMQRRLRLIGSVLRSRTLDEKIAIKDAFMTQFWSSLKTGSIQPIIDSVYPIAEANAAQQYMAENRNTGKIILKVS